MDPFGLPKEMIRRWEEDERGELYTEYFPSGLQHMTTMTATDAPIDTIQDKEKGPRSRSCVGCASRLAMRWRHTEILSWTGV